MTFLRPSVRVARGATYVLIQGIASTLMGFIFLLFLVRIPQTMLPPPPNPEMGIYFILSFFLTLIHVVGTLAFQSASTKYISQYVAEGDLEKARSVVSRVLQVTLIASLVLSISLLISAEQISWILTGSSEWAVLFQILGAGSFFVILLPHVLGFLQGLQKMQEIAFVGLILTTVRYLAGISLLYLGLGLFGVLYGWLIGFSLSSIVGLFIVAKSLGIFGKPHPIKPLIKFSYPLYISSMLQYVASWIDQLFILVYAGEATLGIYGWAVRIALIPSMITTSIVTALFPKLSELYTKHGKENLREAFTSSSRYGVLAGFPMIVGLAILANPIMAIFGQPEYSEAVMPLGIICVSHLLPTLGIAIGSMLMTLERTKTQSIITVVSIFLNITVSYVSLAHFNLGVIGAAWARFLASCISFGLGAYALKRILNITFDFEVLLKSSFACICMTVVVLLIGILETVVSQFLLFPIYIIVGAVVYFLSLFALRAIKKQDLELIHDYLPDRFKRIVVWIGHLTSVE